MRIPYICALAMAALSLAGCEEEPPEKQFNGMQQAIAIDGDTFEAGPSYKRERYRLARIDAPEFPGHCRPGRRCVPGDPERSKQALQFLLNSNAWCKGQGRDVYHRILVECVYYGWSGPSINDTLMQLGFAEEYRR